MVAPRRVVHRLPENVPLDAAVLIEPGSVVLKGLLRARPAPGETVGVDRRRHARRADDRPREVCSRRPRSSPTGSARRSSSSRARLGATEAVDVSGGSAAHEGELDLVVETAGAVPAVELATRLPREGGRVVALGIAGAGRELPRAGGPLRPARPRADRQRRVHDRRLDAAWSSCSAPGLVDLSPVVAQRVPAERGSRTPSRMMAEADGVVGRILLEHRGGMTDRADFLRRAGAGAAGFSLGAAARPGGGARRRRRRRLPRRTRAGGSCSSATTRSIRCSSPRSSAPRTRLRSSAARCSGPARRAVPLKETVAALRSAISAQGRRDRRLDPSTSSSPPRGSMLRADARHPARRLQRRLRGRAVAVRLRRRGPARVRGGARERRSRGSRRRGRCSSSRPATTRRGRTARGCAGLAGASEGAGRDRRPALGRRRASRSADRGRRIRPEGHPRARSRSTACGTLAVGRRSAARAWRGGRHGRRVRPAARRPRARRRRTLDFVVDQQPYVQGFSPVMQLFLARISAGDGDPWDTETSVLLRKADVADVPRHEEPLRGQLEPARVPAAPGLECERRWLVLAVGTFAQTSQAGRASRARRARAGPARPLRPQPHPGGRPARRRERRRAVSRSSPWGLAADRDRRAGDRAVGLLGAAAALAAAAYATGVRAPRRAAARLAGALRREHQHGDRPRGDELVRARDERGFALGIRQTVRADRRVRRRARLCRRSPTSGARGRRCSCSRGSLALRRGLAAAWLVEGPVRRTVEDEADALRHPLRDRRIWRLSFGSSALICHAGRAHRLRRLFLESQRGFWPREAGARARRDERDRDRGRPARRRAPVRPPRRRAASG